MPEGHPHENGEPEKTYLAFVWAIDPRLREDRLQQAPSSLSDVAFGKVAHHSCLERGVEKDIQNCGKNFPVDKTWVPAFVMIPGSSPARG